MNGSGRKAKQREGKGKSIHLDHLCVNETSEEQSNRHSLATHYRCLTTQGETRFIAITKLQELLMKAKRKRFLNHLARRSNWKAAFECQDFARFLQSRSRMPTQAAFRQGTASISISYHMKARDSFMMHLICGNDHFDFRESKRTTTMLTGKSKPCLCYSFLWATTEHTSRLFNASTTPS